jgi:hypothetical protein
MMIWDVVWGVIFVIAGVTFFFKPEYLWRLTESWKSNDAHEPSDLYIISTKIGAVIFFLVGIAGLLVPFLSE